MQKLLQATLSKAVIQYKTGELTLADFKAYCDGANTALSSVGLHFSFNSEHCYGIFQGVTVVAVHSGETYTLYASGFNAVQSILNHYPHNT